MEGKTDEASVAAVGRLIEELDQLCLHPLRFHKEEVYVQVNSLKSKIFYLYNLLTGDGSGAALEYWDKSVQAEVRQTTSIVSQEIEEINEVKGW